MAWFRWGRIRGVHLSGGFGVLRTRRAVELEGYSAALLFHLDLALPTFDTRGWSGRIDLRADLAVVDPTFATVTLGFVLRYRAVQAALRATIIDGNLAMTALLGVDLHRNRSALPTP